MTLLVLDVFPHFVPGFDWIKGGSAIRVRPAARNLRWMIGRDGVEVDPRKGDDPRVDGLSHGNEAEFELHALWHEEPLVTLAVA